MNIKTMVVALAMAAVSVPAAAASAQENGPLGRIAAEVSIAVPYGDLDLSTPEGIAAMRARLGAAARDACRAVYEGQSFTAQLTMDCRLGVLDAARRELAAVILAAQPDQRGTELAVRIDR